LLLKKIKIVEERQMTSIRVAGWAAAIALAVSAGVMGAQTKDWKIDAAHSEADFSIKHMARCMDRSAACRA
jgi:polyisoprenoid-binding protein YceI